MAQTIDSLGLDDLRPLTAEELELKQEKWHFLAFPIFAFDPLNGPGLGVKGFIFDNGKYQNPYFRYAPYDTRLAIHFFRSLFKQTEVQLSLDIPHLRDSPWRTKFNFILDNNPNFTYFGIDEQTLEPLSYYVNNDSAAALVKSAKFGQREKELRKEQKNGQTHYGSIDDKFNYLSVKMIGVSFLGERTYLQGKVKLVLGAEIAHYQIDTYDGERVNIGRKKSNLPNTETLFTRDKTTKALEGIGGGMTTQLQFGIIYDTRDFEPNPSKGIFAEFAQEYSSETFLSDYNYIKTLFHLKAFYSLHPKIIVSGRAGIMTTTPQAPFWEYSQIWSTDGSFSALGGLRTLRGYKLNRFVAPVMVFSNLEVRGHIAKTKLLKQHIDFQLVPFWDCGTVGNFIDNIPLNPLKNAFGTGLRLILNKITVITFDYGVSEEDGQFFANVAHSF